MWQTNMIVIMEVEKMYRLHFKYLNETYDIIVKSFDFSETHIDLLTIKIANNVSVCFDADGIKDFNYEIIKPLA